MADHMNICRGLSDPFITNVTTVGSLICLLLSVYYFKSLNILKFYHHTTKIISLDRKASCTFYFFTFLLFYFFTFLTFYFYFFVELWFLISERWVCGCVQSKVCVTICAYPKQILKLLITNLTFKTFFRLCSSRLCCKLWVVSWKL